jgi:hypothetical protein
MFKSKYVKYVALSALLGVFGTMFGTIGDFQNHALAQITPAPEKAGGSSSDESSSNSPSTDSDGSIGDGDDGGGGSNTDSSGSSSSNDDSESQDISEEEGTGPDSGESNPLMEQIINKVKQDFAAAGLPSLDW